LVGIEWACTRRGCTNYLPSSCTKHSHTAALLVLIGVVSYCLVGRNRISMYVHAQHCTVVKYFMEIHYMIVVSIASSIPCWFFLRSTNHQDIWRGCSSDHMTRGLCCFM
jgi:hypothetical protein